MSFKNVNELRVSIPSHPTLSVLHTSGCKKVVRRSTSNVGSEKLMFLARPLKLQLRNLEKLEIDYIEELTCIWQGVRRLAEDINPLKRPIAGGFPKLESLVAEEERDQRQLELSCRLEYLMLRDTQP